MGKTSAFFTFCQRNLTSSLLPPFVVLGLVIRGLVIRGFIVFAKNALSIAAGAASAVETLAVFIMGLGVFVL